MTWVKLDDGFFRNRKARMAGKDGRALFLAGLCYCAGSLTDGFIDKGDLGIIAAEAEVRPALTKTLVDVGLWKPVDNGWEVNDYHLYNRPAATIRRERDEGRERAARSRERRAKPGRTSEDGSADPSSSRPLVGSSSSSSDPVGDAVVDEEDDWATIIAKQRLADRVREVGKVRSPKRWLVTTTGDVRGECGRQAAELIDQHPEASAAQLADWLTNGVKLRALAEPCSECDNGWVLDAAGDAVPCPKCRAAS